MGQQTSTHNSHSKKELYFLRIEERSNGCDIECFDARSDVDVYWDTSSKLITDMINIYKNKDDITILFEEYNENSNNIQLIVDELLNKFRESDSETFYVDYVSKIINAFINKNVSESKLYIQFNKETPNNKLALYLQCENLKIESYLIVYCCD